MKECQIFEGENVNFVTVEDKLGSAPLSIVALVKKNDQNKFRTAMFWVRKTHHAELMHRLPLWRLTVHFLYARGHHNSMTHALESIVNYIITQIILAFWLLLAYDLLEDRRTIDVIITKFLPLF